MSRIDFDDVEAAGPLSFFAKFPTTVIAGKVPAPDLVTHTKALWARGHIIWSIAGMNWIWSG